MSKLARRSWQISKLPFDQSDASAELSRITERRRIKGLGDHQHLIVSHRRISPLTDPPSAHRLPHRQLALSQPAHRKFPQPSLLDDLHPATPTFPICYKWNASFLEDEPCFMGLHQEILADMRKGVLPRSDVHPRVAGLGQEGRQRSYEGAMRVLEMEQI